MATESENGDKVPLLVAELDQPAGARIAKQTAEARHQLGLAIIEFLKRMKQRDAEEQLGRNPSSRDLLPFFEEYALCVFDAEMQERLPQLPSIEYGREVFEEIGERVVHSISRDGGVWSSVVSQACTTVAFPIVVMTRYGAYTESAFTRPRRTQLRARLQVHAHQWEAKWWEGKSKADTEALFQIPERPSDSDFKKRQYPHRAEWLEQCLAECGWNYREFYDKGGPDVKTTRKIRRGIWVSPKVIGKVVTALLKDPKFKQNPAELKVPRD